MSRIMLVAAMLLAVVAAFAAVYHGVTSGDDGATPEPAATLEQFARPSPVAVVHDSDTVKTNEASWVQEHTMLIANVDPGNDKSLTVTMDGDTWNSWSNQDKELHERGIYNQWVNAYAKFHSKKWPSSAPFSIRIVDVTGTKLASYY
jgi:hypothetical protein